MVLRVFKRKESAGGCEPPQTEALLREALAEPAAPGEDESYRRLMAVIADDLRVRQPVRQSASWAWIPAASITAATAVLAVFAYMAGMDHGIAIGRQQRQPIVAQNPTPSVSQSPPSRYTPPPPAPRASAPVPKAAPAPAPAAAAAPAPATEYIGSITADTLNADQRDLLALFLKQYDARNWAAASESLRRLADTDPTSDLAVTTLNGAAEIQRVQLSDSAAARPLYEREIQVIDALLANETDAARRTALQAQRDAATRYAQPETP